MNKICTSIEQSHKLINLGIDISISDITKHYEDPVEAVFEMVVWLKENKKL